MAHSHVSGPPALVSLQEMLHEARERGFVGREAERAAVSASLHGASDVRVHLVHGPGGIGKTTLLDALGREAIREGGRAVYLDARDLECSASAVAAAVARRTESDGAAGHGGTPEATADRVRPWVDASLWFDRHRLDEMAADVAGTPHVTEDVRWAFSKWLNAGAEHDPFLARAAARIGGLLAAPLEVFASPELGRRLVPFQFGPRYDAAGPTRDELLDAVADGQVAASTGAVAEAS